MDWSDASKSLSTRLAYDSLVQPPWAAMMFLCEGVIRSISASSTSRPALYLPSFQRPVGELTSPACSSMTSKSAIAVAGF